MRDDDSLTPHILLEGLYNILKNNGVRLDEKSSSKAQQRFMGMVHAAQHGDTTASPAVANVAKTMTKKAATDYAKTKHDGLPEKIKKEKCSNETITDEELSMFSRQNIGKRTGRGQSDNPWNHLHKTRFDRRFKSRSSSRVRENYMLADECAGVGIVNTQNSTHDVSPSTLQKNLNAFQLEEALVDMYNTLIESGNKPLSNDAKSSIKGAITTPDANNSGDSYKAYRFGIALAGAPYYPTKATNDIGGDPLLTTYTDVERDMINYAAIQSNVGQLKQLTSNKSVEKDDVYTKSVISPAKRNKYGV